MIAAKFQGVPHILGVDQYTGPKINVVTVMPLWKTEKSTPGPGKLL